MPTLLQIAAQPELTPQDSARLMATATAHQRPLVVLLALLVVLAGLYSAPVAHQANPKAAHKQANQAA